MALPYSLLLDRSAREALGIDLAHSVVILDEAHNLIDAVNSTHSSNLREADVEGGMIQLQQYLERYRMRLSSHNLEMCMTVVQLIKGLKRAFRNVADGTQAGGAATTATPSGKVLTPSAFALLCGVEHIVLRPVLEYVLVLPWLPGATA